MKTCKARSRHIFMSVRKLVCGVNAEATTLGCALLALCLAGGIGPAQAQDALMIGEDGKVTVNGPLAVMGETTAAKVTVNGPLAVTGETTAAKVTVNGPLVTQGNATVSNAFVGDVGHGPEWAGFSHSKSATAEGYGFLQNSNGQFTLINKKSGGGYIGFRVDNVDKMVLASNGYVGIGTAAPNSLLSLASAATNGAAIRLTSGPFSSYITQKNYVAPDHALQFFNTNAVNNDKAFDFLNAKTSSILTMLANGYVGIGTGAPGVPLDVVGFNNYDLGGGFWFAFRNESRIAAGGSHVNSISIRASNGIQSGTGMYVTSDSRIKKDLKRSDPIMDLAILNQLRITDYNYSDFAAYGDKQKKGLIAQEVEKLFPQAVTKSTDVVPDIYEMAPIEDRWVMLATDLRKGDRVRLIDRNTEGVYEVLEVADGKFRTAFAAAGDRVFVYGREVNDFRSVDYDAIAMLNVSATQELARRLEKLEQREAKLSQLEQQAARVASLEHDVAELKRMVAQLAAANRDAQATPSNQRTVAPGPTGPGSNL
jgi:hypothetical protein